tara:strand:- start:978 stop:1511 length:534 start_codon:yes stop_codon:yes gene_type:complete
MQLVNNVLSSFYFERLKNYFDDGSKTQWVYEKNVVSKEREEYDPAFHKAIFINEKVFDSFVFENCLHILGNCCDKLDLKINTVLQARSFLTLPIKSNDTRYPHVDLHYPHSVCLYYLDSCEEENAKTYFYDCENNLIYSQQPIANTAIVFDGSTLHASGFPDKNHRRIININFQPCI